MKTARTKIARASLRKRKVKLDASITRVKRKIKGLTKQLRRQNVILSKRKARLSKLK